MLDRKISFITSMDEFISFNQIYFFRNTFPINLHYLNRYIKKDFFLSNPCYNRPKSPKPKGLPVLSAQKKPGPS